MLRPMGEFYIKSLNALTIATTSHAEPTHTPCSYTGNHNSKTQHTNMTIDQIGIYQTNKPCSLNKDTIQR